MPVCMKWEVILKLKANFLVNFHFYIQFYWWRRSWGSWSQKIQPDPVSCLSLSFLFICFIIGYFLSFGASFSPHLMHWQDTSRCENILSYLASRSPAHNPSCAMSRTNSIDRHASIQSNRSMPWLLKGCWTLHCGFEEVVIPPFLWKQSIQLKWTLKYFVRSRLVRDKTLLS